MPGPSVAPEFQCIPSSDLYDGRVVSLKGIGGHIRPWRFAADLAAASHQTTLPSQNRLGSSGFPHQLVFWARSQSFGSASGGTSPSFSSQLRRSPFDIWLLSARGGRDEVLVMPTLAPAPAAVL